MNKENSKSSAKNVIRLFRPEDIPLFIDMFNSLSKESIYSRFFSNIRVIPDKLLKIDDDRNIAVTAPDSSRGLPATGLQTEEKILGIAHLMIDSGGKEAEAAVLIRDLWQGKGIGTALLRQLIIIAEERGVESLWGIVQIENIHSIALGRKLGFSFSLISDADVYGFHNSALFNARLEILNKNRAAVQKR